jgi:hypothetical protein
VRHDPSFIASGREVRNEMEYATAAAYGYSGALGAMSSAEQEAADAHSRFLSSFNEELRAAPEDGLYNAEGVANVEAVNKALYEQVEPRRAHRRRRWPCWAWRRANSPKSKLRRR